MFVLVAHECRLGSDYFPCSAAIFAAFARYDQLSANHTVVHWLRTRFQRVFGISLPLPLNLVPRKCTVTTVIGPAIPVEQSSYPT